MWLQNALRHVALVPCGIYDYGLAEADHLICAFLGIQKLVNQKYGANPP